MFQVFESSVIRANKSVSANVTSLGFQLHVTDVFLEELAKVADGKLPEEALRY